MMSMNKRLKFYMNFCIFLNVIGQDVLSEEVLESLEKAL
jgi:hypothetical protein